MSWISSYFSQPIEEQHSDVTMESLQDELNFLKGEMLRRDESSRDTICRLMDSLRSLRDELKEVREEIFEVQRVQNVLSDERGFIGGELVDVRSDVTSVRNDVCGAITIVKKKIESELVDVRSEIASVHDENEKELKALRDAIGEVRDSIYDVACDAAYSIQ